MENGFFQRSDGLWEDGQGNFVVRMVSVSGQTEDFQFLRYKSNMTAKETTMVQWPLGTDLAVFPYLLATALLNKGYAINPKPDQVAQITMQDENPNPTPVSEQTVENPTEATGAVPTQPLPPQPEQTTRGEATPTRGEATTTRASKPRDPGAGPKAKSKKPAAKKPTAKS